MRTGTFRARACWMTPPQAIDSSSGCGAKMMMRSSGVSVGQDGNDMVTDAWSWVVAPATPAVQHSAMRAIRKTLERNGKQR